MPCGPRACLLGRAGLGGFSASSCSVGAVSAAVLAFGTRTSAVDFADSIFFFCVCPWCRLPRALLSSRRFQSRRRSWLSLFGGLALPLCFCGRLGNGLKSDGWLGNGICYKMLRDNHYRYGCGLLRLRSRLNLLQLDSENLFKPVQEVMPFGAHRPGRRCDAAKSKANTTQCLVEGHAQCRKYRIAHNWSLGGSARASFSQV